MIAVFAAFGFYSLLMGFLYGVLGFFEREFLIFSAAGLLLMLPTLRHCLDSIFAFMGSVLGVSVAALMFCVAYTGYSNITYLKETKIEEMFASKYSTSKTCNALNGSINSDAKLYVYSDIVLKITEYERKTGRNIQCKEWTEKAKEYFSEIIDERIRMKSFSFAPVLDDQGFESIYDFFAYFKGKDFDLSSYLREGYPELEVSDKGIVTVRYKSSAGMLSFDSTINNYSASIQNTNFAGLKIVSVSVYEKSYVFFALSEDAEKFSTKEVLNSAMSKAGDLNYPLEKNY